MFGKRYRVFDLFGIPIKIDASWFIIAFLLVWSLGSGLFPYLYEGLSPTVYWVMAIAGTLGLFASIIVHELAHALVAVREGIRMRGITLFIFGGVAEMEDEPPRPGSEFRVAAAGPLASIAIAAACYGMGRIVALGQWSEALSGVLGYLAGINGLLVVFNLIPAFPLDGGRILRSALWAWKDNLRWSTRITSQIGSGFGVVLIIMGVVSFFSGNLVGGVWWFLLGMFLRQAAAMSYQQLILRRALEGEPVRRFMHADPVTVSPATTLQELVEDYLYRYHHKMFPVTRDGRVEGCVSLKHIKSVPSDQWSERTVGEVMQPCSEEVTVDPLADSMTVLSRMNRTGHSRLMVIDGQLLVGVVTLKDLLQFLALKVELEEDDETLLRSMDQAA